MKRTRQNTYSRVIGTRPQQLLDPNPERCAFLLTPIVADQSSSVLTAAVFAGGLGQAWIVPAGVVSAVDMYAWGAGGNARVTGVALGGGGGEFARSGPQVVTPFTSYAISVDVGNNQAATIIRAPGGAVLLQANSGTNADPLGPTPGQGGTGGTGAVLFDGGNGYDDSPQTVQAGGGGAGGRDGAGGNGALATPGVGGGAATILGYGKGGNGGNPVSPFPPRPDGVIPGGGGAVSFAGGATYGSGADGLAAVFYNSPVTNLGVLSLSYRQDVSPGRGNLNYTSQTQWPTLITDEEIGEVIGDPWWAVSALAGLVVTVTEFLCE